MFIPIQHTTMSDNVHNYEDYIEGICTAWLYGTQSCHLVVKDDSASLLYALGTGLFSFVSSQFINQVKLHTLQNSSVYSM